MRNKLVIIFIVVVILIIGGALLNKKTVSGGDGKIQVVAAENFWGSLAGQIGGNKVNVLSIVSDPNADPHEYESNSKDARAISTASYVIVNGAGYDSWATKIIAASPSSSRQILNIASLLNIPTGSNPHLWYNPAYVNIVVNQMTKNLSSVEPKDKAYFENNQKILDSKLAVYQKQIDQIAAQFKGVKVAATEDIFAYLAKAADLDLISPPAFIEAVAEGNDPPAGSVATFQDQLNSGQVKLLVYNEQTVTPLTTSMKKLAAERNIPVVGVTETIQPPNASFEDWMDAEVINIENALNATKLGQ
jgi:zinc/manganese transport system substrate-binding protein